ncbi:signal recognition particle-docking protein FtsY [Calycomorphotria hydatis]|uniref:Signal recognition particle receptor FtsY n=1 Tax=Calycomorphotria hydatis TaxID=2528027 RepID=A0A517T5H9_9PLAN|nr:signal recognition particle-docking protein FtsY [Calycomorphotria hydatis]QDT63636.1 Signal recognition particle receptor FtsY [Calycomorphotria hydatis]
MGFFDKLKTGLAKTAKLLNTDVRDVFKKGEIVNEELLEQFEARLIRTDMGVAAADEIVEEIRVKHGGRTIEPDAISETLREKIESLLKTNTDVEYDPENPFSPLSNLNESGITVILVSGVNGVGKTTSIAKLSRLCIDNGKTVLLAAGDTFRAAAVDQLTMWSERLGCEIVTGDAGVDPASVAFRGCERAKELGVDVLIVDTAGRLQTQKNLMDELGKIRRVIGKQIEGGPHESLLVLDATTGQNGISQAKNFSEAAGCTGIILSKLDGSAKGGVVIPICQQMNIPVKYIGTGEGVEDLSMFNPHEFVEALGL